MLNRLVLADKLHRLMLTPPHPPLPRRLASRQAIRFVRRLVLERRIPFIKVGRHVRIATSDLDAFIAAGRVEAGSVPSSARRRSA